MSTNQVFINANNFNEISKSIDNFKNYHFKLQEKYKYYIHYYEFNQNN